MQKAIVADMFVVAMGLGVSANLSVSESSGDIDLSALVEMGSSQGEIVITSNTGPGSLFDCTNWLGKKTGEGRTCESRNQFPCTDKDC